MSFVRALDDPRGGRTMNEEEHLQEMMRKAIFYGVPPDMTDRALGYWDNIEDLIAVLRVTMPDLLKEFGL